MAAGNKADSGADRGEPWGRLKPLRPFCATFSTGPTVCHLAGLTRPQDSLAPPRLFCRLLEGERA